VAQPARCAGRQAQGAGLLLTLAALAAGSVSSGGCAKVLDPPGGPPDSLPPHILVVRPDSGAVIPDLKGDAVIQFDEVIDEMAGGGGGGVGGGRGGGGGGVTGIGRQVVLSPVAGRVEVSWHRSSIHIKPAEGWKPGRVYHLELLPGIMDLRRNVLKTGRTIVFSTGPSFPTASVSGNALLWVEQRLLPQALIRAVSAADTGLAYITFADSTGRFRLGGIPPGRYVIYAVQDANGNRRLDRREAFDSSTITAAGDSTATLALFAFVHDTVGPRLRAAEPVDSVTFRITFNQQLDPGSLPDTARVAVVALPDSTPVPVAAVLTPARYDSLVARERAALDSARRAADTTHARPDTSRRADTSGRAAARPAPPSAPPPPLPKGPPPDTTWRILLRQRAAPTDRLVVRTARPLAPAARYFVRVRGARNLTGAVADGGLVLTTPKPAPRDTTKAAPTKHP
jgi:hypothetical protein